MDSPLTGSPNQSVELLRVETNLFNLYIQGKPYHPTVESMQLYRQQDGEWIDTSIQVHSLSNELEIQRILMFLPETGELSEWQIGDKSWPLLFETQSYELVVEKKGHFLFPFIMRMQVSGRQLSHLASRSCRGS